MHIIISVVSLMSLQVLAAEHPSVSELLDKYAQNADRFQSFRIKAELSVDVKLSGGIGKPPAYLNGESGRLCDVRFDGQRISSREFMWGNLSPRGPIPKGKPAYKSFLWNGKDYWRYSRGEDPLGKVVINRKQSEYEIQRLQYGHALSGMIGYFSGSTERFDSVILKARTASVREETEQVNGVDCFVIDADTKHGRYSVWIDPTHGYSIAKAQVRMKHDENHFYYGIPFNKAGRELYWTINNLQFEEIDGVWVPVEATHEYHRLYSYQGDSSRSQTHTKVTEILMNPDHDALGSFIPDDIPDGAKVHIVQFPSIQYTWQDGKVIDKDGKVIMDSTGEKQDATPKQSRENKGEKK